MEKRATEIMNNNIKFMTERVSHGHFCLEKNNLEIYKARSIEKTKLVNHGFAARCGGVSVSPYNSLNFSLSRPDNMKNVERNYHILAETAEFSASSIVIVNYEHGNGVCRVDKTHCGFAPNTEKCLPPCDAIITNDPDVTLLTLHADCGALFFLDREHSAIGLAHAGWKGTYLRIAAEVVKCMKKEFSTKADELIVAAGPCICGNCYEIDDELAEKFIEEFGTDAMIKRRAGKNPTLDISLCAVIQLCEAGVKAENITLFDACTYEMEDKFFSYRRDKGQTGAMAAFMKLKG